MGTVLSKDAIRRILGEEPIPGDVQQTDKILRALGRPDATFETQIAAETGAIPRTGSLRSAIEIMTEARGADDPLVKRLVAQQSVADLPGIENLFLNLPFRTEEQLKGIPGATTVRAGITQGIQGVADLFPTGANLIEQLKRPGNLRDVGRAITPESFARAQERETEVQAATAGVDEAVGRLRASPALQTTRRLQGVGVLDDPGILLDPDFWVGSVSRQLPSLVVSTLAGMAGGGLLGGLGKAAGFAPKAIRVLTAIGRATSGGSVGGSLEAEGTRAAVLAEGGTQEQADLAAQQMFWVTAALNAIGLQAILGGPTGSTVRRVIIGAIGEGFTEAAEAIPQEVITARAVGREVNWFDAWNDFFTTLGPAAVTGGGTSGVVSSPGNAAQVARARRLAGNPVETVPLEQIKTNEIFDTSPEEVALRREVSRAREDFQAKITATIPNASVDQIETLTELVHTFVEADAAVLSEKSPDIIYEQLFQSITRREVGALEGETKPPKGMVEFLSDGRAVVEFYQNADISTGLHEMAHVFRKRLATSRPDLLKQLEKSLRVKKGNWKAESSVKGKNHEERFADLMLRWESQGKAPAGRADLVPAFKKFHNWLNVMYRGRLSMLGGRSIPKKTKEVFDEMFQVPDTTVTEAATLTRVDLLPRDPTVAPRVVPAPIVREKAPRRVTKAAQGRAAIKTARSAATADVPVFTTLTGQRKRSGPGARESFILTQEPGEQARITTIDTQGEIEGFEEFDSYEEALSSFEFRTTRSSTAIIEPTAPTEDAGPLFQREIDDNPSPHDDRYIPTPEAMDRYRAEIASKTAPKPVIPDSEVLDYLSTVISSDKERKRVLRSVKRILRKEGTLPKEFVSVLAMLHEDIMVLDGSISSLTPKQAQAELASILARANLARQAASEVGRTARLFQEVYTPQRLEELEVVLDDVLTPTQHKLYQKALKEGLLHDPTKLAELKDNIKDPTIWHQLLEYTYSNMLSGPPTHMINFASNWFVLRFLTNLERSLEGIAGSMLKATLGGQWQRVPNKKLRKFAQRYVAQEGVFFGEAFQMKGGPRGERKQIRREQRREGRRQAGKALLEDTIGEEQSKMLMDVGPSVFKAIERSDGKFARAVKAVSFNSRTMRALGLDSVAIGVINKMRRNTSLTDAQAQMVREMPWVLLSARAMHAADVFAKVPAFDRQARALAWRTANEDLAAGRITQDQLADRTREWLERASDPNTKIDRAILIRERARRFARYATFTSLPGHITQHILKIRQAPGPVGPAMQLFMFKYVNTIANLLKRSAERLPIAGAAFSITQNVEARGNLENRLRKELNRSIRADMKDRGVKVDPLVVSRQVKGFLENPETIPQDVMNKAEIESLRAGEQDIQRSAESILAAQFEGFVLLGIVALMYANGRITGRPPRDPREREAFLALKKPYSVDLGVAGHHFWLQYSQMPIIGPLLGAMVDGMDRIVDRPDDETAESGVLQGFAAGTDMFKRESPFGELSDFMQDDTGQPAATSRRYDNLAQTSMAFIPFSGFLRAASRAAEIGMIGERKVRDVDALEQDGLSAAFIKSLSQTIPFTHGEPIPFTEGRRHFPEFVPPKLNVWGDEIVYPDDMLQTWLPIKYSFGSTDIVELELEKIGYEIKMSDFAEDWGNPRPGKARRTKRILDAVYKLTEEEYRSATLTIGKAMKTGIGDSGGVKALVEQEEWQQRTLKAKTRQLDRTVAVNRKAANTKVKANLKDQFIATIESRQR